MGISANLMVSSEAETAQVSGEARTCQLPSVLEAAQRRGSSLGEVALAELSAAEKPGLPLQEETGWPLSQSPQNDVV